MKRQGSFKPFRKALVVDDDRVTQLAIKYLFEEAGFKVVIAADGCKAVTLFDETFSCVTMDYNMPEMNGIEATRQIREKEDKKNKKKKVYIIGLTADISEYFVNKGIEAGMNVIAHKPLNHTTLKEILTEDIL